MTFIKLFEISDSDDGIKDARVVFWKAERLYRKGWGSREAMVSAEYKYSLCEYAWEMRYRDAGSRAFTNVASALVLRPVYIEMYRNRHISQHS